MTPSSRVAVVSQRRSRENAKLRTPPGTTAGACPIGSAVSPSSPSVVQTMPSASTPSSSHGAAGLRCRRRAAVRLARSQTRRRRRARSRAASRRGSGRRSGSRWSAGTTQSSRNTLGAAGMAHGRNTRSSGWPTSRSRRRHSGPPRSAVSTADRGEPARPRRPPFRRSAPAGASSSRAGPPTAARVRIASGVRRRRPAGVPVPVALQQLRHQVPGGQRRVAVGGAQGLPASRWPRSPDRPTRSWRSQRATCAGLPAQPSRRMSSSAATGGVSRSSPREHSTKP